MRGWIDADRIANSVRMLRTQFPGAFFLVEGESEELVIGRFVRSATCELLVGHGKENVIGAIALLDAAHFAGALALVDADFLVVEGKGAPSPNVILTDSHDLECLLVQSPALEKVLAEYGSRRKIQSFEDARGPVRDAFLGACLPIGALRWLSCSLGLKLRFEGLNLRKFVDDRTLITDRARAVETLKAHSQRPELDSAGVLAQVGEIERGGHDPWQVVNGHDLVAVLSLALRRALGSSSGKAVELTVVNASLRLAYETAYFRDSRVRQSIADWEAAHAPFQVLADF